MKLTECHAAPLQRQTPISRRVLQRVPVGRPDWKPLDHAPRDGSGYRPREWTTTEELLQMLEESDRAAREALAAVEDAHLMLGWRALAGGRVVPESPRHVMNERGV